MIAYIDDHKDRYGGEPICAVLPIAPSTYYEHKVREADSRRVPPRVQRDQVLSGEVRRVWEENFRVYGARKVWQQLNWEGIEVARRTVEYLMRAMGLQGGERPPLPNDDQRRNHRSSAGPGSLRYQVFKAGLPKPRKTAAKSVKKAA